MLRMNSRGIIDVDSNLVVKALAQFERTLISGNSKFDKFLKGEVTLTQEEQNGFDVFMDETRGDCFHCHGSNNNPLWTDNIFHNNGLDKTFTDTVNPHIDVLFLCLGHGNSVKFLSANTFSDDTKIIDLGNDFRLEADKIFEDKTFVYGLPELNKTDIIKAKYIVHLYIT